MDVRVVTYNTNSSCIHLNSYGELDGICIQLWRRTAMDLNMTYKVSILDSWTDMINHFQENNSDIVVQLANADYDGTSK